jgi:hypothetical protein
MAVADQSRSLEERCSTIVLSRHVRFARALALVSGAAIGFAAGVTVFTSAGCDNPETPPPCSVTGICVDSQKPLLGATRELLLTGAGATAATVRSTSSDSTNGLVNSAPAVDGSVGGGPLPAPPLPQGWLG